MRRPANEATEMKYRYLYQDRHNRNCEGEIEARDRADAYAKIRKSGIRPYRVIGDDPFDWRPLAFWIAVSLALISTAVAATMFWRDRTDRARRRFALSEEAARAFRARAEESVRSAPPAFRYDVWRGVNVRLEERGLEPIPKPEGLPEEIEDAD